MNEQHALSERPYNPLWDEGARTRRKGRARLAIALSIAAHIGLVAVIYESKFAPHYRTWDDPGVTVELLQAIKKPPAPPPEPARPPPVDREPPPLRDITPHLSALPPTIEAPPPIPVLPRVEDPPPPPPVAADPPRPLAPRTISNPDWSARPGGEDMARYYPERAQRLEMVGNVVLQCRVTAKGGVDGCTVVGEDPVGFGFGDAGLKLARLFKMKPKMEDGQAVEGAVVKIPIAFRIARD